MLGRRVGPSLARGQDKLNLCGAGLSADGRVLRFAHLFKDIAGIMVEETQEELQEQRKRIAQQFIEAIPHARALGMSFDKLSSEGAEISLPWREDLVGDPRSGVIHGGVISALMDTCSGAAVMVHPTGARSTATIDLRIDYMRPAASGHRIRARASCYHVTRSVAFVRAWAMDDDDSRPVAMATGTFTIER